MRAKCGYIASVPIYPFLFFFHVFAQDCVSIVHLCALGTVVHRTDLMRRSHRVERKYSMENGPRIGRKVDTLYIDSYCGTMMSMD